MPRIFALIIIVIAAVTVGPPLVAQTDTTFTYQGSLKENGGVANGVFNLDFRLWDALAGGNQIGSELMFNAQPVVDGRFTVELDFGGSAFDNSSRWLEITVNGTELSPRQPVTRAPYAIQTRGIFVDEINNVGIGTSTPSWPLHVKTTGVVGGLFETNNNNDGRGVFGVATATSGTTYGGRFETDSTSGRGVYGWATAATGITYGVWGQSDSPSGRGIFGQTTATSGNTSGVFGLNQSVTGRGVFGQTTASTGQNYGVFGTTGSTSGRGVYGEATASTGFTNGGRFVSTSTSGYGVYGEATASSGFTRGVHGTTDSTSGFGVVGNADANTGTTYGVHGQSFSTSGRGVFGRAAATSGTTYGGRFLNNSTSGRGVYGEATAGTGITYGGWFESNSTSGRAIFGLADANSGVNYGVVGHSNSSSGFDFWASGAGTNYGAPSSRRFKRNVIPIGDPLDKLAQLRGVYFDWDKEHGGAHDVGMIAEEVGGVMPEIVQYEENGVDAIGMDYSKLTPLLVEAVNALRSQRDSDIASLRAEKDSEITSLRAEKDAEISELRAANDELQQRFTNLESLVSRLTTENN